MKPTINDFKNQVLSIPIAYYAGKPFKVRLDENGASTSYCDLQTQTIYLSYANIEDISKNKEFSDDVNEFNASVRAFTYHELSHLMLTPLTAFNIFKDTLFYVTANFEDEINAETNKIKYYKLDKNSNGFSRLDIINMIINTLDEKSILNILEDERIETINKNTFMNTNFKQNVHDMFKDNIIEANEFAKLITKLNNSPKTNIDNTLKSSVADIQKTIFTITRFRIALIPEFQSIVDNLDNLIYATKDYNCASPRETKSYYEYIKSVLFQTIIIIADILFEQDNQSQSNSSQSQQEDEQDNQSQSNSSQSQQEDEQDNQSQSNSSQSQQEDDKGLSSEEMKELLEKAMTNKCNIAGNDDYTSLDIQLQNGLEAAMKEKDNFNVLQDVLNQFLAKNKNKSGGAAGYSGRFDVRSYVRNQFTSKKYFARPGEGELFKANNLKLNLIIDRSGSFSCNEPIINGFIYKLKELENKIPNFKFDVATFGLGCKLEHKEGLYIYCYDGTRWDDSCNEVIRKMRTPGFTNVTIICVDGTWGDPLECHFSEFNNSNTIFVSDRSNKNNIESYAPKAKSIILRKNYAEEFIKESIKVIKEVLR